MIETLHFPATKCNIHVVVCRFFECAWGAFKGGARWYVKLRLAAFDCRKKLAANDIMKLKRNDMKTYILKYEVCNTVDFPIGTVVKITDDYWGNNTNDVNTGFTVVSGKLKGEKGYVADGLNGWLIENTITNRKLIKSLLSQSVKFQKEGNKLQKIIRGIKPAKL